MLHGTIAEIYHLSPSPDNDGYAVRDIVSWVADSMGTRLEDVSVDVEERLGQDAAYIIDSTKARTELGWKPTVSIDDGLREVVDWTEANWNEIETLELEYQHKK